MTGQIHSKASSPRPSPRVGHELLPGYHSPQVDVSVRLNTNESPFPPPAEFQDQLSAFTQQAAAHRYPDREARDLRNSLARLHGADPDGVFCGNGSNEVIQTLALTYGGPGRKVAVFEPTFAMHSHVSAISGAEVLKGRRDSNFSIDPDELRLLASQADITFLCSPNNPTGTLEPRENVVIALEATKGVVVVDEAYGQFSDWSAQELQDEDRPLVVLRTFSKTWAMAGVRLGYSIGPHWLTKNLWKTALPYHLSTFTQAAGTLALEFEAEMQERVGKLVDERNRIQSALADMPVQSWESHSNFVLLRPLARSGRDLWQRLLDQSVLVRDCSSWPALDDCLRVTVGTEKENTLFLDAMEKALDD